MRLTKNIIAIIGILLLFYVIRKIGLSGLVKSISEANYLLIAAGILFFLPMILLQTAKWDFILKKQKVDFKFSHLLKIQVVSIFYELVTPARIGSFIKIPYLQEKVKNFGKAASSVVIDRSLDFLSVAFLAFIGSLLLLRSTINIFYASIIVFAIFLLGFIVLTNKILSKIIWNIAYQIFIPKKFKKRAMNSFNEFYKALPNFRNIFILSLVTLFFWLVVYTQAYIFALAFNIKIPYLQFICIFPISIIVGLIPITVGGFGTREATLLVLFSKFAVSESGIVAFSLAWAGLSIIIYAIPSLYILFKKKI